MLNKKLILCAALVSLCPLLPAQETDSGESAVIHELTRINEEIALLSARKKEIELKTAIATQGGSTEMLSGANDATTFITGASLPVVKAIEGVNGKLNATISYGAGAEQTVKTGDKIRDKWKIKKITFNSVTLTRGRQETQLLFGQEPAAGYDERRASPEKQPNGTGQD